MAEWLRALWKDMMNLVTEETNQVYYELPVMLPKNLTGRRQGNI